MSKKLRLVALAVGAFAFVAGIGGTAQAQNKCQGEKIKAAGKKAGCKAGIEAKQASAGGTIDPAKVAKCEAKLSSAFAKQEAGGACTTTGDAAAIEAKVDAFVADLDTELAVGSLPNKCQGEKIKAAGKKAGCKLGLESSQASKGGTIDPAKVAKCEAKLSSTFAKQEAGGACNTTGDAAAIEAKVDAFVVDVDTEENSPCCAAAEIQTLTSAGVLVVDSLNAFPFPAGVQTHMNVGAAGVDCKHGATVHVFNVPPFCIVGLGFTSDVFPVGCESGTALGNGSIWDAASATPTPNIFRQADTMDGTCNPAGQPCNTTVGGAGANTLGNINAVRGGPPAQAAGVVHTQLDIPVHSLTWSDGDGSPDCPDEDGIYDSGVDGTITDFNFILSPTTGQTRAQYVDQNADSCSFAGGGPASTRICTGFPATPCSFAADCPGAVACVGGALQGVAPAGPCCTIGQATTVVATGAAFSGAGPLFDLIFMNSSPTTISDCNAPTAAQTCTLTTDPCAD